MRKIVLIFLSLIITTSLYAASEIDKKVDSLVDKTIAAYNELDSKEYRNSLAITELDDNTGKDLGVGLTELLTTKLSQSKLFRLVERKNLKKLLKEQALSLSGILEPQSAIEVGKLSGADILLVGSITKLGTNYLINLRLIETKTGTIMLADKIEIEGRILEPAIKEYIPAKYRLGVGTLLIDKPGSGLDASTILINYGKQIRNNLWGNIEAGILMYYKDETSINNYYYYSAEIRSTSITPTLLLSIRYDFDLNRNIKSFLNLGSGMIIFSNSLRTHELRNGIPSTRIDQEERSKYRVPVYATTGFILFSDYNVSAKLDIGYIICENRETYQNQEFDLSITGLMAGVSILVYF